ncbi:hypothetical protein F5879DRAFT_995459 [Lentinula edodes]|nr:hypothetical protein F5879DRAFT_995459 [Lentinula edodes]
MALNMLDDQDTWAVDRQELARFQRAQEQEAALAAKHKHAHTSPPRDRLTKKRQLARTRSQPGTSEVAAGEVPRVVRLVFPPARPAPPPLFPSPPHPSSFYSVPAPRVAPVSRQTGSVWDPEPLVQLAEVAGHQPGFATGSAAHFVVPTPLAIKGPQEAPSPLTMPPANCPALVPRVLVQHPYRAENERLIAQGHLLESQLASSRQENLTLTSALRDTLTSLEARQGELKQLRASTALSSQQQEEYDRLMDQVQALQHLLPGPVDKPLVDRFQDFEESHRAVEVPDPTAVSGGRVKCASHSSKEEDRGSSGGGALFPGEGSFCGEDGSRVS